MNKIVKITFTLQILFLILYYAFRDDSQFMSPADLYLALAVLGAPVTYVCVSLMKIRKKQITRPVFFMLVINVAVPVVLLLQLILVNE